MVTVTIEYIIYKLYYMIYCMDYNDNSYNRLYIIYYIIPRTLLMGDLNI